MNSRIRDLDLTATLTREESEERLAAASRRLVHLRLYTAGLLDRKELGPGLIVLFEGFDASGKGGAIRRLTSGLDPRHVRVSSVSEPTPLEKRHHFLWRFQPSIPGHGEMTVFDRSWYGRLLVERVEQLIDQATVKRSADEIVEFEQSLVNDGATIVKFWLHISDEEQLKRFHDRANSPTKQWKLTADDWRNREKRADYLEALDFMFETTDHGHAHWDVIAAEDKHFARVSVLETLIERWEHDLKRREIPIPESHDDDYLK